MKDRENFPDAYDRPEDVADYRDGDPAFARAHDFADESAEQREERRHTQRRSSAMFFDDGLDALFDDELEELARMDDDASLTDEDRAYVNRRRGRGVYDPEIAQRNARRRFTQRKRILFGLVAVTATLFILGFVVAVAWAGCVVGIAATGLYLTFLRKQAVEEQRLAARRLRRMRRAQMGVRNAADDDAEHEAPSRLRRPVGTVIETNDTDPELAELDYVDAADYFTLGVPDDAQRHGDYVNEREARDWAGHTDHRGGRDGERRATVTHIRHVG